MDSRKERLISLDVMRGLTVACMILVNNGAGPDTYAQLRHSAWHGLTLCDFVFPFFLFMVGVSIYISLQKTGFQPSAPVVKRILKRTLLLFVIGLLLHGWDMATKGNWNLLSELRVWGVLQRIAICYGVTSLLCLWLSRRTLWILAGVLLAGYMGILSLGNGYDLSADNIIAVTDRAIFGTAHLYRKSPVDPEGLLSTIPAIAHTIIGFGFGRLLMEKGTLSSRMGRIGVLSVVLLLIGFGLTLICPLNKRIWSSSYVMVTCASAGMVLLILMSVIDYWRKERWCLVFRMFGMNAFFIYVLSEVLAPALSHWGLKEPLYEGINRIIQNTCLASLTYALLFVAAMGLAACLLWKKKIIIKI